MNKLAAIAAGLWANAVLAMPAQAATLKFNLQPVSLCESGHPETCRPPLFDSIYLNRIFEQIGVRATVLETAEIDTLEFDRDSNGDIDVDDALTKFGAAQSGQGVDDFTVYAGFSGEIEGSSLGLSLFNPVGAPAINPFAVVENSLSLDIDAGLFDPVDTSELLELFPGRYFRYLGGGVFEEVFPPGPTDPLLRMVTAILAHEIGHVLGGLQNDDSGILMSPVLTLDMFEDPNFVPGIGEENAAQILQSGLLTAVPIPPALPLMALGVVAMVIIGWRRA